MMKRMSFSETIFLFLLALIVFGPKKLPEIARQVGKWMNEFRRASNEFKAQIEQEISSLEVEDRKRKILPPSPAPAGTASRALNASSSESASSVTPTTAPASAAQAAAATDDEPLFAAGNGANQTPASATADPANRANEEAASSVSQESHA